MISIFLKRVLSAALSLLLILTTMPAGVVAQQPPPAAYPGQGAPLTAEELQGLVAPIALYPDALVAQILGAATFPDQVTFASTFLQTNANLTGTTLVNAVNTQT